MLRNDTLVSFSSPWRGEGEDEGDIKSITPHSNSLPLGEETIFLIAATFSLHLHNSKGRTRCSGQKPTLTKNIPLSLLKREDRRG
jgi:hypothetical protein